MRKGAATLAGIGLVALSAAKAVSAQEFSRILRCQGELAARGKPVPANADFALRANNQTALVQRSNVLPEGERLHYTPTNAFYTMTYRLPVQGTRVVALPGWFYQSILVLNPDLTRLNQIRIAIDRQTGALDGKILNERDEVLVAFSMQCSSVSEQDAPAPKL